MDFTFDPELAARMTELKEQPSSGSLGSTPNIDISAGLNSALTDESSSLSMSKVCNLAEQWSADSRLCPSRHSRTSPSWTHSRTSGTRRHLLPYTSLAASPRLCSEWTGPTRPPRRHTTAYVYYISILPVCLVVFGTRCSVATWLYWILKLLMCAVVFPLSHVYESYVEALLCRGTAL